jgi:hypothetical protein
MKVTTTTVASAIENINTNYGTRTITQSMALWAVDDYLEANEEEE